MGTTLKDLEIIYVGDPMCSWCWGFAPVIEQIRRDYGDTAAFRIIVGGLRPGEAAQKMEAPLKTYIREHWQHVKEASGQPFNFEFFERTDFLYDTEPPARAVVTVRHLAPEKELPFLNSLQQAFYSRNLDITAASNYEDILLQYSLDPVAFLAAFHSEEMKTATRKDFEEARRFGIRGFPSVLLRNGGKMALLAHGYQTFEALAPHIRKFFEMDGVDAPG